MDRDSDSTVTSLDENTENLCENQNRDILAKGILNLFKPVIEKLDEQVRETRAAQIELRAELDALAIKLTDIENAQYGIPDFTDKVKELINIKHKVSVIATILTTSQERLANLHKIIENE